MVPPRETRGTPDFESPLSTPMSDVRFCSLVGATVRREAEVSEMSERKGPTEYLYDGVTEMAFGSVLPP